jgi:hypothetical protein
MPLVKQHVCLNETTFKCLSTNVHITVYLGFFGLQPNRLQRASKDYIEIIIRQYQHSSLREYNIPSYQVP